MTGDISVGEVNIGTVNIYAAPDAAHVVEDLATLIRLELERTRDSQTMGDVYGRDMPDMDVTSDLDMPPTSEEEAELDQGRAETLTREMIDLETRSANLHMLVGQVDKMNSKQGFGTNDEHQPDHPDTINRMRSEFRKKARNSLKRACEVCVLREGCPMADDLDAWLDAHPYKDKSGKRRPGSIRIEPPEARRKFIERLRANPKIHCDPSKRKL